MNENSLNNILQERRGKARTVCHYPAIVQGHDPLGEKYEETGEVANLSATGLYMILKRSFELGEKIFVTVQLNNSIKKEELSQLATTGIVTRIEPQPDEVCGIAIQFQSYRFL